jgi:diguanylate cyclase (GGDEF)-like protein
VAERIAGRVKDVCKRLKLTVAITASIGISFTSEVGFDYHHLKEIADDRLYLAKKQGKNRIIKNSKKITKNR